MALSLVTAPDDEPLSLEEAKEHLRVSVTEDDQLIAALIIAARERAEQETRRALITQTWKLLMDAFPSDVIRLPMPPCASVTHVKYYDTAGTLQTASGSTLYVTSLPAGPRAEHGRIALRESQVWPSTRAQIDSVEIQFVAGYGDAEDVPQAIKQGMLLAIGHWYANREEVVVGTIVAPLPLAAKALWAAYDARTFGVAA